MVRRESLRPDKYALQIQVQFGWLLKMRLFRSGARPPATTID